MAMGEDCPWTIFCGNRGDAFKDFLRKRLETDRVLASPTEFYVAVLERF